MLESSQVSSQETRGGLAPPLKCMLSSQRGCLCRLKVNFSNHMIIKRRSVAGINGFGRFGLGLFRSWFFDPNCSYEISFINDDAPSISDILRILQTDPIITEFHSLPMVRRGNILEIRSGSGNVKEILITKGPIAQASWLGSPDLIFECSGITRSRNNCRDLLISKTQNILVGSTTEIADSTLVMGYNHADYRKSHDKIISFGSCTVIPGVHLISFVKNKLKLKKCSINIVHSVPKWQLDAGVFKTIRRKECTLESIAPKLIKSIDPKDIKVNYTYAPYYGVSLMDFEFDVENIVTVAEFASLLSKEVLEGKFKDIISLTENDIGPENHINSPFSISIVKSSIDIRGNRIYFFGYFNNEGSGIRLHELAEFIFRENSGDHQ